MPVGGETLIVGPYTATWAGVPLGIFEGDAGLPTLEFQTAGEDIANTNIYGKALLDSIYQGANVSFQFTCLEYRTGSINAAFPQSLQQAIAKGRLGTIGVLQFTSHAQALVLTAVAGTPAANTPTTLTAAKTVLAHGFGVRLVYGPTLRKIPLRLRALLMDISGNPGYFTET